MKTLWSSESRDVSFQDVWGRGFDWPAPKSNAGVSVNVDSALGLSAVLRCVRLLADTVSTLPMHAYRQTGDVRQKIAEPRLLTAPSLVLSPEEWVQQAMVSLLLWGNAYGVVTTRDRLQVAESVEWVTPDSVTVKQDSALRPPRYILNDSDEIPADDMVHIRAFLKPGSVSGAPPLTMQRETLGLGIAAQKFGAEWFGSGAHPSSVLYTDQAVNEEAAKTVKDRFVAAVKGRKPAVLGGGMKYQQVQVAANESQFLETHQAIVNDVARAFGVPAEMIGGGGSGSSLTYANREQSAIDFLTFSVNPWLIRLERALTEQLPEGTFVKFNPDALLRTDTKSRYEAHAIAIDKQFLTLDEVRSLENRAPLDVTGPGSSSRSLSAAEVSQKVYLAVVNGVITVEEARQMIAEAGADITP